MGQLVGEAANTVQLRLRDQLAEALPGVTWTTEYAVGSTPVDVGGEGADSGDDGTGHVAADTLVLVELEWRWADPADNTAKLFRHLVEGTIPHDRVRVFQVFTAYYDLASGGLSSKRKNAEFVGDRVASSVDGVSYDALTLGIDPPKRGGEMPADWRESVDAAGRTIVRKIEGTAYSSN